MNGLIKQRIFRAMRCIPDKPYLTLMYLAKMKKVMNWKSPVTFNEKLQWLKLYDRRPEYTQMVDKYEAKKYVADRIGERYIIPTFGVWERFEDIDFDALPGQFVLKCTHDSGGLAICRDRNTFDIGEAKVKIENSLKNNFFYYGREWPYKNVKPRIIAEQYMEDVCSADLADYKIHCFNGIPKVILVCRDRYSGIGLTEDFYSDKWEHLDIKRPGTPNAAVVERKPEQLEEMLRVARVLSKNMPFVRADFYVNNNKVYFGELTLYPAAGVKSFEPDSWDKVFGDWLKLPEKRRGGALYIK